jgi:hypothetical protein
MAILRKRLRKWKKNKMALFMYIFKWGQYNWLKSYICDEIQKRGQIKYLIIASS